MKMSFCQLTDWQLNPSPVETISFRVGFSVWCRTHQEMEWQAANTQRVRVCFTAIELPWCPCPFLSLSLVSMSTAELLWQKAKSQLVCFFRDKRPLLVINTNKHTYCFQLNYSERRLIREFLNKPVFFFFGNLSNQNFLKVEYDCGVPCLTAMLFSLTTTTHCFHRCLMGLWACLPAACRPIFTSVR